jgi:hypothetical protein
MFNDQAAACHELENVMRPPGQNDEPFVERNALETNNLLEVHGSEPKLPF